MLADKTPILLQQKVNKQIKTMTYGLAKTNFIVFHKQHRTNLLMISTYI